jgi:hypothetical protein
MTMDMDSTMNTIEQGTLEVVTPEELKSKTGKR